jgi:hypothetical protein
MIEYWTWGRMSLAYLFTWEPASRPALDAWPEIDRALDAATEACVVKATVVLVPTEAEKTARGVYVVNEGGPPTIDLVVAVGYVDRTVSMTYTEGFVDGEQPALQTMLDQVWQALQRDDLADALRAVAAGVAGTRR